MKFKGIELNGTYKVKFEDWWFNVYDEKGKLIYVEFSDGRWYRKEYDSNGNRIYFEDNNSYWLKAEYDEKNNEVYFENSHGYINDKRVKEMTIDEIEELLGYKIKLKGESK